MLQKSPRAIGPIDDTKYWDTVREVMDPINSSLIGKFGDAVLMGPFTGMRIITEPPFWNDGNLGTKLMGIYESELHSVMKTAVERKPNSVLNFGCAEGYYAVGLARMLPDADIIAIDQNAILVDRCNEAAQLNGIPAEHWWPMVGKIRMSDFSLGEAKRLYIIDIE